MSSTYGQCLNPWFLLLLLCQHKQYGNVMVNYKTCQVICRVEAKSVSCLKTKTWMNTGLKISSLLQWKHPYNVDEFSQTTPQINVTDVDSTNVQISMAITSPRNTPRGVIKSSPHNCGNTISMKSHNTLTTYYKRDVSPDFLIQW